MGSKRRFTDKEREERHLLASARWVEKNPDYKKEYYKKHRERMIVAAGTWRERNLEKYREMNKLRQAKYNAEVRREAFNVYGRVCVCCGETEEQFLTLDHFTDAVGAYRKNYFTGKSIKLRGNQEYRRLRRLGWPPIVRVFCMNCNWASRLSKICPHQIAKGTAAKK